MAVLARGSRRDEHARARAFAVMGAVTIAFSSILVRLSHASPSDAAIFRCVYALPVLALFVLREDRLHGRRSWRQRRAGLLSGVFFGIDMMLWNRSIVDVGAGLATVLANIQVVLVPLVAWALLSERPARSVLWALPISGFGVLLISGVLEHGAYGRDPRAGTLLGLGAGVAYVGFLLLLRRGGADLRRPAGPLLDATLVAAVVCIPAGLVIGDAHLVPTWPSAGWLALLALSSQVLGWLLITSSLPRLPAALTSVLLTLQPLGSVALAALIFGESPSPLQLVGVALVLGGLLAAGRGTGARRDVDARAQDARAQDARAEDARAEDARAEDARAEDARAEDARAEDARAEVGAPVDAGAG